MTDIQLLIETLLGIFTFYLIIKYLFGVANKARPEIGHKMKKSLKALIIHYSIGMIIQIIT